MRTLIRAALASVFIATVVVVVTAPTTTTPAVAVQTKPNIIVITTDDMRVDDLTAMPQAKALIGADDGLGARYTNSYASVPLCCPYRASFLTGQHTHNHGVIDNSEPDGGWEAFAPLEADSLPVWLDNAGYQTVMLGKYMNQYGFADLGNSPTHVPPGWDSWQGITGNFVNYEDFDINVNGSIVPVEDGYQTWNFNTRAQNSLDSRLPSDDPVFMWLSYTAPHNWGGAGCHVPAAPEYEGDATVGAPGSDAFNEANVADKPSWVNDNSLLTQTQINEVIDCRRERRDALRSVDDSVAEIVDTLQDNGELSNTVIMFTSDNGWMLGEHRIRFTKQYGYEESAAVPLLVRGPASLGFTTGQKVRMVSNVDLPATIADVADATPTLTLDGQSLLAAGPPAGSWRPLLIEKLKQGGTGSLPSFAGIRVDNWAYFDYGPGNTRELYDLDADPWQTVNRIGNPALNAVKQSLMAELEELRDCVGIGCVTTWTEP